MFICGEFSLRDKINKAALLGDYTYIYIISSPVFTIQTQSNPNYVHMVGADYASSRHLASNQFLLGKANSHMTAEIDEGF